MPHLFFSASDNDLRTRGQQSADDLSPKAKMWDRAWHKVGNWFKGEGDQRQADGKENELLGEARDEPQPLPTSSNRRPERAVVPSLPRPLTFRRQNSERREHLYPHEPDAEERRASSVDRRAAQALIQRMSQPAASAPRPSFSAPNMRNPQRPEFTEAEANNEQELAPPNRVVSEDSPGAAGTEEILGGFPHVPPFEGPDVDLHSDGEYEREIQAELDAKWILNLSMHHRDDSDREKFFITYAEEPNKWRRLTVSIDYRNANSDSLELEIKGLPYQRHKSKRIFESIRESLREIQFYQTVTNLKLQTTDGRIHVHVTEDINEIIPYPPVSRVGHILNAIAPRFKESDIKFDSHMSGFVYLVRCPGGGCLVKKEIPGPEAVEEFLYEVDALHSLHSAPNVIGLAGLVVSDDGTLVKGLLINHAQEGALVDLLYDFKHSDYLPWSRRSQWAKQIVHGLSELHEAGFTQGDFTLSNIVIDAHDNAKIIDINRRGCPVGWEPPELIPNISAGQRISMRIGPKTDLFQLGMVLWALGEEQDEPEHQDRPLKFSNPSEIPEWYRDIVEICLSEDPRHRLHAKELLNRFQDDPVPCEKQHGPPSMSLAPNRLEKEYIDPETAVSREDIDHLKAEHASVARSRTSRQSNLDSEVTFADAATSTEYVFESSGSFIVGRRERSAHSSHLGRASSQNVGHDGEYVANGGSGTEDSTPRLLPPPMEPVLHPGQALPAPSKNVEAHDRLDSEPTPCAEGDLTQKGGSMSEVTGT